MSRHSVGDRAAGAGSTTLPSGSLYSPAGSGGVIREIGVFNTTATAVAIAIRRLTSAGTQGAGLDELDWWDDSPAAAMTGFNTHTVGPTITAGFIKRAVLGAAIGSGVIWTFPGEGLIVPPGTANGIGIVTATGTGQVVDFYFEWEE